MSSYKISLKIEDMETGMESDTNIVLDVRLAPSGLYIASNASYSNVVSAGKSPFYAILEYIADTRWDKTVEAEKRQEEETR